jgi:dihydrofolate synthase/folylpolyglutamate synthase
MDEYQKTLARLYDLQKFGIKLGLSSTENLLRRLGDPHLGLKCVHLAGTNGKGSAGAMLEAALLAANTRVGFYTSPHLIHFKERFRLAGAEIGEDMVVALAEEVWSAVDMREPPTFFGFITALALLWYARERAEWVILETGMGGRLDATNLCRPAVTVITNIGLEHQEYLGRTLSAIAYEKAGIIKPGVTLVHGVGQPAARLVVEGCAAELGAPMMRLGRDIRVRRAKDGSFGLVGTSWRLEGLTTNLVGRHQPSNAGLALAAAEALAAAGAPLTPEHFRQGLTQTRWPGRLEHLPGASGEPDIWLDGAHNLPAARALLDSLDLVRAGRSPLVLLLGVMADKDYRAILAELVPAADLVIYSRPVYSRAADPALLAAAAPASTPPGEVEPNLARALSRASRIAGPRGTVLVTGSLFIVGEALAILRGVTTSDLP